MKQHYFAALLLTGFTGVAFSAQAQVVIGNDPTYGYTALPNLPDGSLYVTGKYQPGTAFTGNFNYRTFTDGTNEHYLFTIKGNNGFTGIGTTSPAAKLHVIGLGGINIDVLATGRWKTTSNDGGFWVGDNKFIGSSTAAAVGPIGIYNGGKFRLMVKEDGRVVIGDDVNAAVAATGYALSVRGKVFSEEVKVALTSSWPDYVFAPTYQLRPLAEVGQFIAQNQHLPGMPSAQQVSTGGGIELGKMNAQLLEKVEELTLYLLEQQQQMEVLKQEVAALKSK